MTRRLVARLDNVGDVVLTGPAVRAVAASGEPVTYLAGPSGWQAAELLPGVADVIVFDAPWVSFDPPSFDRTAIERLIDDVASAAIDEAIVLTSYHQSPLPLALLLRSAGVARIAATSVDYPGSLLDMRHPYLEPLHEVEQSLAVCRAAGHEPPAGDDGRLRLRIPASAAPSPDRYVVVHPGASVPARALPFGPAADVVTAITAAGVDVVVTGSGAERPLAERLARKAHGGLAHVAAGTTQLADFARLLSGAEAVVCGNSAPSHIAAAVGTPVVVAFAPVVPAHRWRPWGVAHVLLGTLGISCAGCRSRSCPIPGQPCLAPFTPAAVLDALGRLGVEPWAGSQAVAS